MKTPNRLFSDRIGNTVPSQLRILARTAAAVLAILCAPLEAAEVRNIISEIEGDTECIAKATRTYYTWLDYNDGMAKLLRSGVTPDRETMRGEADYERRMSWREPKYRKSAMAMPMGSVEGEENTRFGAIPNSADIAAGYILDWTVSGFFGYGSFRQPRVESITEIVIKPDYAATIEFTNEIQMFAQGSISGTSEAAAPWPQQGEHDATLTAIDILGKQHRLNVSARATAMATTATSSTDSKTTTQKWTVSGGVSASSGGPSGNIGGSYEETSTVSSSQSSGSSVPTVPSAVYNKDYSGRATKVVEVDCGGTAKVSRAVQINGHFYTRSFARDGKVSTSATHGSTNTLKIKVTCRPCGGSTTGGGEPSDPSGGGADPSGGGGGATGPITQPDADGYGSKDPDPLEPKERNGITVTPSHGGVADPSAWWNDPRWSGGGCVYVDQRYLPPFVEPVEKRDLEERSVLPGGFGLKDGMIPLLVPDDSANGASATEQSLVPLGYLKRDARVVPLDGTIIRINPATRVVGIEGGFWIDHPRKGSRDFYSHGAEIHFRAGQTVALDGTYEITGPVGVSQRVVEMGDLRLHQVIQEFGEGGEFLHGQVVEDVRNPGVVLFSRAGHNEGNAPEVIPEVVVRMEGVRQLAGQLEIDFVADWRDIPFVVQMSDDLKNWHDFAAWNPGPNADPVMRLREPIDPEKPAAYFRARSVPELGGVHGPLGEEHFQQLTAEVQRRFAENPEEGDRVMRDVIWHLHETADAMPGIALEIDGGTLQPGAMAEAERHLGEMELQQEALVRKLEAVLEQPEADQGRGHEESGRSGEREEWSEPVP